MKTRKWLHCLSLCLPLAISNPVFSQPAPRPDSPQDMQELLAETAANYREAKSFRVEKEMVGETKSELF